MSLPPSVARSAPSLGECGPSPREGPGSASPAEPAPPPPPVARSAPSLGDLAARGPAAPHGPFAAAAPAPGLTGAHPALVRRRADFERLARETFDAVVVGGGINGAMAYRHLVGAGYRTLLVDARDFAGGTSQSSGMMVWGGLLYLANFDFPNVHELCAGRDGLLRDLPEWVVPRPNRVVLTEDPGRGRLLMQTALYTYWVLGGFRRPRPRFERDYPERAFLRGERLRGSVSYEEAVVEPSDSRFVLRWILGPDGTDEGGVALNHCRVDSGAFDRDENVWRLELRDGVAGGEHVARARVVVNAAGIWTDDLNRSFGIETPVQHVMSKGVFLALPRYPGHDTTLTFENRKDGDCMSLMPWGQVSLFGPTETVERDPEGGFAPTPDDVRFLLSEVNRHLIRPVGPEDVISLRCGIRPLVVDQGFEPGRLTLSLSRRHALVRDRARPWISLYGGKLTSCVKLGGQVVQALRATLAPRGKPGRAEGAAADAPSERFPSLDDPVVAAGHAAVHEHCLTLEDYLRRRTNVAQWVRRGGLGQRGEHETHLRELARLFAATARTSPDAVVEAYRARVARELDAVLAQV